MMARAGEKATQSGDCICQECSEKVHVEKGQNIPKCPCGGEEFSMRETQSAQQGKQGKSSWQQK